MTAPKKIWVDDKWEAHPRGPLIATNDVTPYIRADLVDGLVEALKLLDEMTQDVCEDSYGPDVDDAYYKARAALKALEEE